MENKLQMDPFTFCKVKTKNERHFFSPGQNIYFDGEIRIDEETGNTLYSMIGKVDGYTLRQWLEHTDFVIFKTFEQWSR
jgi:hypothetical protein